MTNLSKRFSWLLLFLCVACAKKDHSQEMIQDHGATTKAASHENLEGSLESNAKNIYRDEAKLYPCDRQWKAKVLEMAYTFDRKAEQIKAFAISDNISSRRIPLGPISLREDTRTEPHPSGWQEDAYGWQDIYQRYLQLRDTDISPAWVALNSSFRATLLDDKYRIVYETNYALDKDSEPNLLALQAAVNACINNVACAQFSVPASLIGFVNSSTIYLYHIDQLQRHAGQVEVWREKLNKFLERLNYDETNYQMQAHKGIRRVGPHRLDVDLFTQDFSSVRQQLEEMITAVWNQGGGQIQINWKELPSANWFSIIAGTEFGARSSTSGTRQTITLQSNSRRKTIPHEFGHLLGFPDYYYTKFDNISCQYIDQYRYDDIMSGAEVPVPATSEEWQKLLALYPMAN